MAIRKPLVIVSGKLKELPAEDILQTNSIRQINFESLIAQNLDFGSVSISAPFSTEEIPDFFTDMAFWDESIDLGGV